MSNTQKSPIKLRLSSRSRRGFRVLLPCLGLSLVSLVACGGDDDDDTGGSSGASTGGKTSTSSGGKSSSGGATPNAGTSSEASGGKSAGGITGSAGEVGDAGAANAGAASAGGTTNAGGATSVSGGTSNESSGGTTNTSAGSSSEGGNGEAGNGNEGGATNVVSPKIIGISPTGPDRFYGVTYDAQGNVYAVGQIASSTDSNADIATVIAKFTPAGAPDTTFGAGGFVVRNMVNGTNGELFRGIVVQSSGKIVVSGNVEHPGAADPRDRDIAVARFNADGSKDTTFGSDGIVTLDLSTGVVNGNSFLADSAWGLDRYADDRLVISGGQVRNALNATDTDFAIVRLSADGVRDANFGTNGVVNLDTQQDGASVNASPRDVTILPGTDGVIGAGYQPIPGAGTGPVVYKVTDAGVLDTSFGIDGVFSDRPLPWQTECYAAVVQPAASGAGYKLVTTGYGKGFEAETTDLVSLRLHQNGTLDTTYGTNGVARIDIGGFGDNSRRVMVLPDRRVLLIGGGRLSSANVDGILAFLTPEGAPDTTFAPNGWRDFDLGGPADFLWSGALSPDKRTIATVGIRGVGNNPTPASANDDAALFLFPLPQ